MPKDLVKPRAPKAPPSQEEQREAELKAWAAAKEQELQGKMKSTRPTAQKGLQRGFSTSARRAGP